MCSKPTHLDRCDELAHEYPGQQKCKLNQTISALSGLPAAGHWFAKCRQCGSFPETDLYLFFGFLNRFMKEVDNEKSDFSPFGVDWILRHGLQ